MSYAWLKYQTSHALNNKCNCWVFFVSYSNKAYSFYCSCFGNVKSESAESTVMVACLQSRKLHPIRTFMKSCNSRIHFLFQCAFSLPFHLEWKGDWMCCAHICVIDLLCFVHHNIDVYNLAWSVSVQHYTTKFTFAQQKTYAQPASGSVFLSSPSL